jgi:hypothetical protein
VCPRVVCRPCSRPRTARPHSLLSFRLHLAMPPLQAPEVGCLGLRVGEGVPLRRDARLRLMCTRASTRPRQQFSLLAGHLVSRVDEGACSCCVPPHALRAVLRCCAPRPPRLPALLGSSFSLQALKVPRLCLRLLSLAQVRAYASPAASPGSN